MASSSIEAQLSPDQQRVRARYKIQNRLTKYVQTPKVYVQSFFSFHFFHVSFLLIW